MNPTDWAAIEDSENAWPYAPRPERTTMPPESAHDFLMGDGTDDTAASPGPWFAANYPGECSACFAPFFEGDLIRADGDGEWEAQECQEDH